MDRVDGYLQVMGLGPHADKPIDTVSTGTRRAVEIACQLAMEPTVLLLDEPSSGLAQAEVEGLGPALQQIVRDTGCAVVLIEHDLGLLHLICDRLLAMDQGRVITSGPPAEVLDHPLVRDDYAAASALFVNRSGAVTSSPHTTPSSASLDTRPGARHDQH